MAPAISRAIGKKYAAISITTASVILSPMPFILRMVGWFPENGTDALFLTLVVFNAVEVTLIITSSAPIAALLPDVVEDS